MRMRRKKWARPELESCEYFIDNPLEKIGKWKEMFNNNNPIHLELGCGKGTFISVLGSKNKNINYIAIDIKSDILGSAKRNIDKVYQSKNLTVDNLLLFSADIQRINQVFSPQDVIERIYINFCNPWNKPLQNKKRLTHSKQLCLYKTFLINNGEIYFKTDDDILFQDSIKYFKENGFEITFLTYDLHNSDFKDNIITEHEEMFSAKGIKIKGLIARLILSS